MTGFGHGQGKDGLHSASGTGGAVEWVAELFEVGENDVIVERDKKPRCPVMRQVPPQSPPMQQFRT